MRVKGSGKKNLMFWNMELFKKFQKKALNIEPDLPGVQHRLNALLGITTDFAPRQYVEDVFNSHAKKFDNHLVDVLKYDAPILLKKALFGLGLAQRKYKDDVPDSK